MNRRDFLIRSATLIGACLLPMPEAVGVSHAPYAELAKHFKYDLTYYRPKLCWLATLTCKLQDKEQADWIAFEYIEEASQFDKAVKTLERAMARRYVEIANRDN